ncbi:uncharacterized protein isoform X2 [Bombus fervidus]|uniref:uncharacterized protein n=1 Tax=Bombus fervidus TaxID=203811 RepID=UPI003D189D94
MCVLSFRFFGKIIELESKVPTADEESKLSTLLSVSAHTLPPMKMLCASFITSLLSSSVSKTQSTDDRIERDETMHNDEESEESEEELSRRKSRRPTCMSLFQVLVRITGTHRIQLPIRCSLQT